MSVGSIEPQFYDVLLKGLEMSPGKLTARPVGQWLRGGQGKKEMLNQKIPGSIHSRANFFRNLLSLLFYIFDKNNKKYFVNY
jgi:hypothetical protein